MHAFDGLHVWVSGDLHSHWHFPALHHVILFHLSNMRSWRNHGERGYCSCPLHLVWNDSCMHPYFHQIALRTFSTQAFGCSRRREGIWLESSSLTTITTAVTSDATVLKRNRSPPNIGLCNLLNNCTFLSCVLVFLERPRTTSVPAGQMQMMVCQFADQWSGYHDDINTPRMSVELTLNHLSSLSLSAAECGLLWRIACTVCTSNHSTHSLGKPSLSLWKLLKFFLWCHI